MSTRKLEVLITGDASGLQRAFKATSAASAEVGQAVSNNFRGVDSSVKTASASFIRTGKVFKATGKAFRSSGIDALSAGSSFASTIPALSGVAGGAGAALAQIEALGSVAATAGPAGLAALGVAAVGAAAAYAFLHDDVSAATDALRAQAKANAETAATHKATTEAVYAHKDALASLRDGSLSVEEAELAVIRANERVAEVSKSGGRDSLAYRDAQLALEAATQKVAKAQRDHGQGSLQHRQAVAAQEAATRKLTEAERAGGKGSLEYREAVLAQKRAQDQLRDSRADLIRKGEEAIEQTHRSRQQIKNETEETKKNADAARQRALGIKMGLIAGDDAEEASKEIKRALDAEARAGATAARTHRDNAQRTMEMANAIGTATPRAKALHDRLQELAQQELDLASAIAAMQALSGAADTAAAGVAHVYDLIRNPPSAPTVNAPSAPGKGKTFGFKLNERSPASKGYSQDARQAAIDWMAGRPAAAPGSPLSLGRIGDTGDRAARAARLGAEATARKQGKSETEISNAGQRAYANARLATIQKLQGKIKTRRASLLRALNKARSARASTKVPAGGTDKQNKARQKALDARRALGDKIRDYRDELETLAVNYADLQVESSELGADLKDLDRSDEAAQADAADEAASKAADAAQAAADAAAEAPTERDYLEANAARAALTAGKEDDVASADALVALAEREMAAAEASGDPRRVIAAAQALSAARQSVEALKENTDALKGVTDAVSQAFGGSAVFSFRGQTEVLRSLAPPSSDRDALLGGLV